MREVLPQTWVDWVKQMNSDNIFNHFIWINPSSHPWRFALVIGLAVGIAHALVQLTESLPPNLVIWMLVSAILIIGELAITMIGFTILGGYLGLRPPIFRSL